MKNKDAWRGYVRQLLKGAAFKAALSFIASKVSWLASGPFGFLTNIVLERLWDSYGRKVVDWATNRGLLFYDVKKGKVLVKKLKDAKDNNDQDKFDSTLDDIVG